MRVICAIAEAGSLTRAAASLGMTQPGLSAQLRRIEVMLGGPIFDRGQAGAAPTALGELVLPRARAILPGIDGLLSDTARAARCQTAPGRGRLGSVGAPLLADLIVAARELIPGSEVTARCQYSPSPLLDDLVAGRLEAAILGDNPGHELSPREGVVLPGRVADSSRTWSRRPGRRGTRRTASARAWYRGAAGTGCSRWRDPRPSSRSCREGLSRRPQRRCALALRSRSGRRLSLISGLKVSTEPAPAPNLLTDEARSRQPDAPGTGSAGPSDFTLRHTQLRSTLLSAASAAAPQQLPDGTRIWQPIP